MDEQVVCALIVLLFQHISINLRRLLRNRRDTLVEMLRLRRINLERMRRLSFEQIQEAFRQSSAAMLAVKNASKVNI